MSRDIIYISEINAVNFMRQQSICSGVSHRGLKCHGRPSRYLFLNELVGRFCTAAFVSITEGSMGMLHEPGEVVSEVLQSSHTDRDPALSRLCFGTSRGKPRNDQQRIANATAFLDQAPCLYRSWLPCSQSPKGAEQHDLGQLPARCMNQDPSRHAYRVSLFLTEITQYHVRP